MDNLRVEDFLPYYLQYDEKSSIYPDSVNTLYDNINAKREFNINRLPASEEAIKSDSFKGKARKHQEFMGKFMSPLTPYNRMLVFHEVGTGKCVLPDTKVFINQNQVEISSLFSTDPITIDPNVGFEEWCDVSDKGWVTKSYKDGRIVQGRVIRTYRQYVEEDICIYKTPFTEIKCTKRHKLLSDKEWLDYNYIIVGTSVKIFRSFGPTLMLQNSSITSLELQRYKGIVYDLEVEDTHNYVANNFVTHNTCLLSNVVELAKQQNPGMNKPLILVRGQTIKKNIIKEIANKCFPEKYIVGKIDLKSKKVLSQETIDRRTTKNVNRNYQIETFFTFAKQIKNLPISTIEKIYSNRYIFVDEAHRLREQSTEEKEEKGEKTDVYME
jgi:hypothetical protein